MKNKVIIITHQGDNDSVEKVMEQVRSNGFVPLRFDTDVFPEHISLEVSVQQKKIHSQIAGKTNPVLLHDAVAVWYRRSKIGHSLINQMEPQLLNPALQETNHLFWSGISLLPVFQMDHYLLHRQLDNKMYQLVKASQCGLLVPDTLYTNNPAAIKQFYKKHQRNIVGKMFSSFAIYDKGEEQVVFTTKITPAHLRNAADVQYSPMCFQQNIAKKRELRISIVGNEIFCAAINSQKMANARIDWRKEGVALINDWYVCSIPAALKKKLLKLMDVFYLNYGAIDVIETKEGEYYYLETNSGGEYFWLDSLFDYNISKAIGNLLCGKGHRRQFGFYP